MSMQRVFHRRFPLAAKCAITIFLMLAFYLFWIKMAIVGVVVVAFVLLIIERVLHTKYVFSTDDKGEWLTIHKGRFARSRVIAVNEIIRWTSMKTSFGLSRYLLLEYGAGKLAAVQPESDEAFILEIRKRQGQVEKQIGREAE